MNSDSSARETFIAARYLARKASVFSSTVGSSELYKAFLVTMSTIFKCRSLEEKWLVWMNSIDIEDLQLARNFT